MDEDTTPEDHARLAQEFDKLFSTVTGYSALDERIAKTQSKKNCLLMVLDHLDRSARKTITIGIKPGSARPTVARGTPPKLSPIYWADTFLATFGPVMVYN